MNEKLNKIIKDEIGVDDGSFMPDAAREPWILLLSSLTAWRKIKSSPIRLFYSPFGGRAVLKILTYYVYAPVSARWSAPNWLQQLPGGPGSKYLTH